MGHFEEILEETEVPAIAASQEGIIFFINSPFEQEYGWNEDDLIGNALTTILPPYTRDAHNIGFSRFLNTQTHRILDKKISLPVYCKNGSVRDAIHFITAKQDGQRWQFAALLDPQIEK
ncbi:MAG TPA: PAS domain-containing protein [Balneolaceae bacterium]|nr:PAS domain-containing protein [Balneolaceae bacterium]